jgi:hypothetical protein
VHSNVSVVKHSSALPTAEPMKWVLSSDDSDYSMKAIADTKALMSVRSTGLAQLARIGPALRPYRRDPYRHRKHATCNQAHDYSGPTLCDLHHEGGRHAHDPLRHSPGPAGCGHVPSALFAENRLCNGTFVWVRRALSLTARFGGCSDRAVRHCGDVQERHRHRYNQAPNKKIKVPADDHIY